MTWIYETLTEPWDAEMLTTDAVDETIGFILEAGHTIEREGSRLTVSNPAGTTYAAMICLG